MLVASSELGGEVFGVGGAYWGGNVLLGGAAHGFHETADEIGRAHV